MTELSWLVNFLLAEEFNLSSDAKKHIAERIKEVEALISTTPQRPTVSNQSTFIPPSNPQQCASTLALMQKHADPNYKPSPVINTAPAADPNYKPSPVINTAPAAEPAQTVAYVAQTPQTAAAMQSRQEAINVAISGKPEPGRKSPRKW